MVNPIDGLNNFSRGIALFATTVAYCENGEVKASVIYNRASDELYFAEKGNGSYKEGFRSHERLRVSTNKDETFALISAQVGYDTTSEDFANHIIVYLKSLLKAECWEPFLLQCIIQQQARRILLPASKQLKQRCCRIVIG